MNKIFLIMGLCVSSMAYAEPRKLPPIINSSTYANGAAYAGQTSANQPMLEMLGRIDSQQTEIQKLRGLVEQQSHEINNLKQRQQNIYNDMNTRLQKLETGAGISVNAAKSGALTTSPRQSNTTVPTPVAVKQTPVKQSNSVKPKSKADEKAAFDKAFASVKNSHYQQAIKLLEQFLLDYSGGVYADNAHFWLGSVYKVVNDVPAAKKNFQAVYTQFPKSEKAGMAMLKVADIYREDNNTAKAQQLYTQITTQYSASTAAHMAEKTLQNMGQ